jgi:hypothetical protein
MEICWGTVPSSTRRTGGKSPHFADVLGSVGAVGVLWVVRVYCSSIAAVARFFCRAGGIFAPIMGCPSAFGCRKAMGFRRSCWDVGVPAPLIAGMLNGSPAASPAVVLAQAFAAHGVRVAPYVREQQPVAPGRRHSEWVVVVSGTARLDEVIWPRFGSDRHTGLSRRRPSCSADDLHEQHPAAVDGRRYAEEGGGREPVQATSPMNDERDAGDRRRDSWCGGPCAAASHAKGPAAGNDGVSLVNIFEVLAMYGAGVGSICWVDGAGG